MKRNLALLPLAASLMASLASCSDNDELTADESHLPAIETGALDIGNGMNVLMVDADHPERFKLKLGTKRSVRVHLDNDCPISLTQQTDADETRYLVIESLSETLPAELPAVYRLRLELADGSKSKDMHIVLRKRSLATADVSEYARNIGHGTKVWADLGNVTFPVISFENIADHLQDNVNNVQRGEHFEVAGARYEETLDKMSVNVGVSGSSPTIAKKFFMSGGVTFGQEKCTHNINNMEFYLGYYYKVMAEVKMNRDWLSNFENNGTLFALLDETVNDAFNNPGSGAYANYTNDEEGMARFFDNYGTHVIMQGSFGGSYIYMYGRKENAYEESIGHDASANIKFTQSNGEAAETWLEQYQKKMCSSYISADGAGSDYSSEYRQASGAFSLTTATGGDASMDIETWDKTIRSDNPGAWALVSYTTMDTQENHDGHLLPITYFIADPARKEAAEKYLEPYLKSKVAELTDAQLVLADFKMVNINDGQDRDNPKPIVDKGPDGATYYIYYPMMANQHAPKQQGYALHTHQDAYIVDTGTSSHYWYYALGYHHECPGFTDIRFSRDSDSGWLKRGNHADTDVPGAIDNVYVQIVPGTSQTPYEEKIKAVALMNESDDGCTTVGDRLLASTGGSEFKKPFESSENKANYDNYWQAGHGRYDKTKFYSGGLVFHTRFYVVYSKTPLPISNLSFGDGSSTPRISHPTKWGH